MSKLDKWRRLSKLRASLMEDDDKDMSASLRSSTPATLRICKMLWAKLQNTPRVCAPVHHCVR